MRNIIELIKRLYMFLLFLALQAAALALYFTASRHHNTAWLNTCTDAIGNIQAWRTEFSGYLRLGDINDELSIQNSLLREEVKSNYLKISDRVYQYNDTIYLKNWEYRPARVVNNSVQFQSNFITLDQGADGGVKEGMGVIANNSVVGKVVKVSTHFSVAMSVLHEDFKASVKMKGTGVFGTLIWEGDNALYATVNEIPKEVKVELGDTIVTTGFSPYFPAGCMVGIVSNHDAKVEENVHRITVKLSTNFRKLSYVDVVNNTLETEQQQIETEARQEYGAVDSQ
ncbi:MAG: rod shape-determining protein MreC [Flavobacteriales bacterium]|nr:rod shape-determining protein MreC [Flavobacteriales bacterium]